MSGQMLVVLLIGIAFGAFVMLMCCVHLGRDDQAPD